MRVAAICSRAWAGSDGGHLQGDVLQDFGAHAPGAEGQHRPERGVPAGSQEQFQAALAPGP